jgi:hypothetical protein
MFFSRNDIQEKIQQRKQKSRVQIWRPHERNLGDQKDILSFSMDTLYEDKGNYCWPKGFWIDYNHMEDSIRSFIKDDPFYDLPNRV